jgi:hypothetical protein
MTIADMKNAVTFLRRVVAHGQDAEILISLIEKMENEIESRKRN